MRKTIEVDQLTNLSQSKIEELLMKLNIGFSKLTQHHGDAVVLASNSTYFKHFVTRCVWSKKFERLMKIANNLLPAEMT